MSLPFTYSLLSRIASFPSYVALLFFPAFILFPPLSLSLAGDEPFIRPANWGGTGLMEIPTARVMKENSYRVGFSQIDPYRYYYGGVSPLKGLEFNLRITEVMGVPAFDPPSENFRDKAFDVKYQFLPEGKYLPALAIGFMDPHGTRLYPSQYIVASKQIYPFDFTLGFGNGRFGDKPLPPQGEGIKLEIFSDTSDWFRDSQFFWGIQFAPSEKFALMFEYSPIKYHEQTRDPAQSEFFQDPVPSKYNFGLIYRPTKWLELDLSYQRGNEIGVHASLAFDIGNPLIPIYDPPYREKISDRKNPVSERIIKGLYQSGFSDILVTVDGNDLWVEAQNEKYYYPTRALGIILSTIINMVPEEVDNIHLTLRENGIPQIELSAFKADIHDLFNDKLTVNEFLYLSGINTAISRKRYIRGSHKKSLRYGIKPSLETFLNDPSGFFKYRLGVTGWVSYNPWKGATLITSLEGYPVNNISSTVPQLSIPVRSDIVLYKQENVSLGRMLFDQIYKSEHEIYGKVSLGLLEIEYAGIDAEVAMPVLDGKILLGLSGSIVKKRDPDNPFGLKDDPVKDIFTTAFINTRVHIPEIDVAVDLKAGRFLAGDPGVKFTVSKFINGVILRAWYTFTDTSDFTDPFNDGYRDKGISVSIPIRLFAGTDSKTVYQYSITPWTRDTGQDIYHFGTLFDFMGRNTKYLIDKNTKMLYR